MLGVQGQMKKALKGKSQVPRILINQPSLLEKVTWFCFDLTHYHLKFSRLATGSVYFPVQGSSLCCHCKLTLDGMGEYLQHVV
jgi:hypothetical protein